MSWFKPKTKPELQPPVPPKTAVALAEDDGTCEVCGSLMVDHANRMMKLDLHIGKDGCINPKCSNYYKNKK